MMMSTLSRRETLDRSMISNCRNPWACLHMEMLAVKHFHLGHCQVPVLDSVGQS